MNVYYNCDKKKYLGPLNKLNTQSCLPVYTEPHEKVCEALLQLVFLAAFDDIEDLHSATPVTKRDCVKQLAVQNTFIKLCFQSAFQLTSFVDDTA